MPIIKNTAKGLSAATLPARFKTPALVSPPILAGEAPGPVSRISRVVSAEQVARAIVSGIESGARTVYVPAIARAFMALESLSSTIMDWFVRRQW